MRLATSTIRWAIFWLAFFSGMLFGLALSYGLGMKA